MFTSAGPGPPARRKFKGSSEKSFRPDPGRLKLTEGKKVFEIRPAVAWDKGKAVLCLMDRLDPQGRATPVYLGDDRTDEDAFRALAGRGLTVCIGGRRPTAAQYRLPDVAAVWRFLQALYLL